MATSTTGATSPTRGRAPATWRVVVEWTEYALPNEAELDAYRQAIGGQVHLPAELAADFYPNTLTAEVRVTAATLRHALRDGLARVQQGIPGCIPTGVRAGIVRPRTPTLSGQTGRHHDERRPHDEHGASRALAQHDVAVRQRRD